MVCRRARHFDTAKIGDREVATIFKLPYESRSNGNWSGNGWADVEGDDLDTLKRLRKDWREGLHVTKRASDPGAVIPEWEVRVTIRGEELPSLVWPAP